MDKGKDSQTEIRNPKQSKTKKRLWVVTELYYPEDDQTGYYLTRIAEGLAEGYELKVI